MENSEKLHLLTRSSKKKNRGLEKAGATVTLCSSLDQVGDLPQIIASETLMPEKCKAEPLAKLSVSSTSAMHLASGQGDASWHVHHLSFRNTISF